jgi:RNA recognition motif-containing protein
MYTNPEDAAKAVNVLDNYEISNRKKIGVVMSKDNCRLFVGKIPKYVTREQILEEISNETEGVVNVIVKATVPSPDNPHPDTNFAFVEYETHHAAAMARRILLPTKIKLFGVDVTVDWAQPEEEANGDVMSRVTNLYVRSIQETVSESQLQELFSCKGQISVSKVKKIMDYAFVHFNCREAAETALRLISRDPTFGSQFSSDGFKLEVKWARPQEYSKRDKSRQNRGGYADNFNHRRDNDNGYNNQNYNRSYHSSNGYQGYSSRQYYRQEYNPHHQYERRSVTYTQNRNQSSGNYFAVPHFSGNQAGSENRQSVFNSVR